ncbi:MAG: N-acetyltransferase [Acidobacteria bacterium]|nr:N-acetyltransferase [Acidobacteriota bacterium]
MKRDPLGVNLLWFGDMTNDVFIHPTSIVESDRIGKGTKIWAFTHVMKEVEIGENCNIGEHCFLESGVIVGSHSTIKNGNMLWEGVVLDDGVFVGPQVCFTNDTFPRSPRFSPVSQRYSNREWLLSTRLKQGASIGAGAVLLPGLTIAAFAMVGAGSVVTSDVPAHALVTGNPARVRKWVCQCGHPLEFQQSSATCSKCGETFAEAKILFEVRRENFSPSTRPRYRRSETAQPVGLVRHARQCLGMVPGRVRTLRQ